MRDEMSELADANPVHAEDLRHIMAVDRRILLETIEGEGRPSRRRLASVPNRMSASTGRVGFIGAGLAVAAAFAAIAFAGIQSVPDDQTVAEPAEEQDQNVEPPEVNEEPVVVEVPTSEEAVSVTDDDPTSETGSATVDPCAEGQADCETAPAVVDAGGDDATTTSTDQETDDASTSEAEQTQPAPQRPALASPFDPERDLLSLHYDHAPGLDDAHAAVASRAISLWLGIQPHVVSGTYGYGNKREYNSGSEKVMRDAWGGDWHNAHADRGGALSATVTAWLATIDGGGTIWIAEGGQSNFTADVIREIKARRPGLDTRLSIQLVQHSDFNETATADKDLAYVKAETTYTRIADGNKVNATADLDKNDDSFRRKALNSSLGATWRSAFEYTSDWNNRADFSDTVEVLHILGVGTDIVADTDDFADYFFTN